MNQTAQWFIAAVPIVYLQNNWCVLFDLLYCGVMFIAWNSPWGRLRLIFLCSSKSKNSWSNYICTNMVYPWLRVMLLRLGFLTILYRHGAWGKAEIGVISYVWTQFFFIIDYSWATKGSTYPILSHRGWSSSGVWFVVRNQIVLSRVNKKYCPKLKIYGQQQTAMWQDCICNSLSDQTCAQPQSRIGEISLNPVYKFVVTRDSMA